MTPATTPRMTSAVPQSSETNRSAQIACILMLLVLAGATAVRAYFSYTQHADLSHVSGVWLALADDVRHGTFYRALYDPSLGYGAVRYFPLNFVLHGELARSLGLFTAGYALSLVSVGLVLTGAYRLMRNLGANAAIAATASASLICMTTVQVALFSMRGDALPAGLDLWALALCAERKLDWKRSLIVGAMLALAAIAKPTAGYAALAIMAWLLLQSRTAEFRRVAVSSGVALLLLIAAFEMWSGGRFLVDARACLMGGGARSGLLMAPWRVAGALLKYDPESLAFVVVGGAAFLLSARRRSLLTVVVVFSAATTLFMFGTPGIEFNHLLDLQVLLVTCFIVWAMTQASGARFGYWFLAIAMAIGTNGVVMRVKTIHDQQIGKLWSQSADFLKAHPGEVLAENPLLPILDDERPYLMDAFYLRSLSEHNPSYAAPALNELDRQAFSVVVLEEDPGSAEGQEMYSGVHFGSAFMAHLKAHYTLAAKIGARRFYIPQQ